MPSPEYIEIRRRKRLGIPFKAHFTGGTGNPLYHLFPVLIGLSRDPTSGAQRERALCFKYVGNNGYGWRCFSPTELANITDSNVALPTIPAVDRDRQNCVETIDDSI